MAGSRIQRRLLASHVAVVVCAIVATVAMLDRWLGDDVRDAVRTTLEREAGLAAAEAERAPPSDLAAWTRTIAARLDARALLVDGEGRVLAESGPSLDGRDVVAASARWGERTLRLTAATDRVTRVIDVAQQAAWVVGIFAVVLATLLADALARRFTRPLAAATQAARAMSAGDFGAPLPEPGEDEIGELVHALQVVRRQLAARIDELRAEGVKLRTILDGMTEGVALVESGVIAVANPAFRELLGASSAVEGRTPLEAAREPELATAIARAGASRSSQKGELAVGRRSLAFQVVALADSGRPVVVVVLDDVTESKNLERMRREFVANASHELRTPVAAIAGVAETLSDGAAEDPKARASFLAILLRHAQRLSRLTSDLLDLSRIESGYRPRIEPVPVRAALSVVLGALRTRADERGVKLVDELPDRLPAVAADRAALEQILTNLVDNGIKYTREGGHVRVRAGVSDEGVDIAVEDDGPGIPDEHLPRLFERFYRVDNARSRELGGTGLGLAIVKHLVLANNGAVRVESEVGKGSRFHVVLPQA